MSCVRFSKKGVLADVEPTLKAAEKELQIYRDQLLHAAVPGLTIGIMLRGVEKILHELRAATARDADPERVKRWWTACTAPCGLSLTC